MSSFDFSSLEKKRSASTALIDAARKKPPMHSGRWTLEEEQYVEGMITEFKAGLLPIAEGTTLRSFLAKMLNCNPKRVSKKYDGNPIYNGKSAYLRAKESLPPAEACARQENLLELERKFREALSTMRRVESRLQSLTSHLMPPEKKSKTCATIGNEDNAWDDTWRPSSAVSSLTEDDPEANELDQEECKVEEHWTLVTRVSDHVSQSTGAKLPPLTPHTASEEAAGQVLLQLNASKPPPISTAASRDGSMDVKQAPRETMKPQAQAPSAALLSPNLFPISSQFDCAAAAAPAASMQNNSSNGELQGLLQKLAQMRQQPHRPQQQQQPQPQGFQNSLGMPPVSQPQNAQQSLQQLLQTLLAQQQRQQQQQQQEQGHQQLNLSTAYQFLRQPENTKAKPEPDLQDLLGMLGQTSSLVESNNQGQEVARVRPGGDKVLGGALRQIIGNNRVPTPQNEPRQEGPNLSRILQSFMEQQQQAPPPQPAQQKQDDGVGAALANLVDQLRQRQRQQQQEKQKQQDTSAFLGLVQALLSSAGAQQQQRQRQQSKPPQEQSPQDKSLQQLLMQLQQTRAGNGGHFQM